MKITKEELNKIIAELENPIVTTALKHEEKRRNAMKKDYNLLLEFIKLLDEQEVDLSLDSKIKKIKEVLENDIKAFSKINDILKDYVPGRNISWSLFTNKMIKYNHDKGILPSTLEEFDEKCFSQILKGNMPQHLLENLENTRILGNNDSEFTFFTTQLLSTTFSFSDKNIFELSFNYDFNTQKNIPWINSSSIVTVNSFPEEVVLPKSSYSFQNLTAIPHSGYAFGGQSSLIRDLPFTSTNGPEDCSSWICKLFDINRVSTASQYELSNYYETGKFFTKGFSLQNEKLISSLKPIKVKDLQKDLMPGTMFFWRNFEKENPSKLGYSGHTGIILSSLDEQNILTMEYARAAPETEGFGVVKRPFSDFQSNQFKKVGFFEKKDSLLFMHKQRTIEPTKMVKVGKKVKCKKLEQKLCKIIE